MKKDIVVVFEPFDKPSQVLINSLLDVKSAEEEFFRVRIKPYPSYSNERLFDYYDGRLSIKTGQYLENPESPNRRALRILRETEFDVNDRKDQPKYSHLGIIFPTRLGGIPNFIKYISRLDADEKQLKNPKYWTERFENKILILAHDPKKRAKLPSDEAINRYNRIWVVHENILEKIFQKCTACGEQMSYTKHLYCPECNVWNREIYPIPKEHPKCYACGNKYKKAFDTHKLRCPSCKKTKTHKRVKYIGPLTPENLKSFDFIGEYEKAMTTGH